MEIFDKRKIFENVKKVYLIGIGGIGMSGIAEYLVKQNIEVSGSDITITNITQRLKEFDITVFKNHDENNLSNDTDLVVYTSAIKEDNDELKKAKRHNIKLMKRAEMLGYIVNDLYLISVSGSHGKTTTTAMISKVLIDNDYDPTVFVGGSLDFLEGGSSRIGESKYAVVEADEYDKSFLTLSSDLIVVTSIEKDHSDIYKSVEDLIKNFRKFIDKRKSNSKIAGFGDDKNVLELLTSYPKSENILYGFESYNDIKVESINQDNGNIRFSIQGVEFVLKVPGKHNVLNSLAALVVCNEVGISKESFKKSIEEFPGVQRRLQLKFNGKIKIYDDYAHHPTEVEASLKALKVFKPIRIITVFQPHLYSRTSDFYREFAVALTNSDVLILAKIYPAREKEIEGVSSELIFDEFNKVSVNDVYYLDEFEKIIYKLDEIVTEGDLIVFQGAGDVTNLCDLYVDHLKSMSISV